MAATIKPYINNERRILDFTQKVSMEFCKTIGSHIRDMDIPNYIIVCAVDLFTICLDPITVTRGCLITQCFN